MFITEKMKELREWATFALSALTVLAIPIGMLILRDVQFEIKQEISKEYVSQESYKEDKSRQNQDRQIELQTIGLIQGKLESIQIEQIHQSDSLVLIKEQLANKRNP